MTTEQTPLMFLSGAGLGDWIWDKVRAALPGPSLVAPRPSNRESASLTAIAQAALDALPPGRLTLVAHSVGGVIAKQMLHLAPERVDAVLGVAAAVPRAGGSFASAMPAPAKWLLPLILRVGGTRPPESAIRKGLAAGVDPTLADRIVAEFAPESKRLYLDPASGSAWGGVAGYLGTTRDAEVPTSAQRSSARELGARWRRELPTGHLPMLEAPEETAEAIAEFLRATP